MPRVLPRVHWHPHGQTHQVLASSIISQIRQSPLIRTTDYILLAKIVLVRISSTSSVPLHAHRTLHGQTLALLPLAMSVNASHLRLIQIIIRTLPIKIMMFHGLLNTPLVLLHVYLTQVFGLRVLLIARAMGAKAHPLLSIITTIAYISSIPTLVLMSSSTSAQIPLHIR